MKTTKQKQDAFIASLMPDSDKKMVRIASASLIVALMLGFWATTYEQMIDEIMFESELYTDSTLKPNTRRISLAVAAVSNLHPEGTIRVVEMSPSQSFLREAIYKDVDNTLAKSNNLSEERRAELERSKKNLLKWFDTLRFEEHYEYHIGVDESNCEVYEEPETISYYMVAVNFAGTKAFVMKDRNDQSLFFDYLGSDFKNIFLEADHFKSECIK